MNELLKKSASEQRKALLNKEISAVELVNATYERIGEVEDKVKAFNSLTKDTALETAKKVDEKIAKGEELPLLAGIPLALKDNMKQNDTILSISSISPIFFFPLPTSIREPTIILTIFLKKPSPVILTIKRLPFSLIISKS